MAIEDSTTKSTVVRPTDGKGLFELFRKMRDSKEWDFSSEEKRLLIDYMKDNDLLVEAKEFFDLDISEKQKKIDDMDAKQLLMWYQKLNRSLFFEGEYCPSLEEKQSFYESAVERIMAISRGFDTKTASDIELSVMVELYEKYSVDFNGKPLEQTPTTAYFFVRKNEFSNEYDERFPQTEENVDENVSPVNGEAVEIIENDNDSELNDVIRKSFELNSDLESIANIIYYTDGEDDYDYDDDQDNQKVNAYIDDVAPWSEEEKKQLNQLDAFFKSIKIEHDDEWHKDKLVRKITPYISTDEKKQPYTATKLFDEVYELAKEAAIQEVVQEQGDNIDTENPAFIRRMRKAVLDQMQSICTGIIETQISRDLVGMVDRDIDTNEPSNKEEIKKRAKEIYENLSLSQFNSRWQKIKNAAQNLFGVTSEKVVTLQDTSILSYCAGKAQLLKKNAQQQLKIFGENTVVGRLFVKSKERIESFEAKLAKEHPYLNVIYSSAKMIGTGMAIGALGSPVATAAWIGYNIAKADKAFYNEYLKARQTQEVKSFRQFLGNNPLRTTLTVASNVGAVFGIGGAEVGGTIRMTTGAVGIVSSAAKDFAQGNWKMGLTKMATYAVGYFTGSKIHGEEINTEQVMENSQNNTSNISQEVYDKAVQDVNHYAQNMSMQLDQPEATSTQPETNVETSENKPVYVRQSHDNVTENNKVSDNIINDNTATNTNSTITDNVSSQSPEIEQYVEQPPHPPALDENGKITLIGGNQISPQDEDSLIQVTVEQSDNGVVETEIKSGGEISVQRSIVFDADGNKHCVINDHGTVRYMTPDEEEHFIHILSHNGTIGKAGAGTAELVAKIHDMPAVQDVERTEYEAQQQNEGIRQQPKDGMEVDLIAQGSAIDQQSATVVQPEMPAQPGESEQMQAKTEIQPDDVVNHSDADQPSATVMQPEIPAQPGESEQMQAKTEIQPDDVVNHSDTDQSSATVTQPEIPAQQKEEVTVQNADNEKSQNIAVSAEGEMKSQQETIVQPAEVATDNVLYSGPEGTIEHSENSFVFTNENHEKIIVTRLDDEHVSWVKEDASGHQTALSGPQADKAYAQIYSHLPECSQISFEFQNMKLDYDTEQTALRVAATQQIIGDAKNEIEAGKAQEKIGQEVSEQAEKALSQHNQNVQIDSFMINPIQVASEINHQFGINNDYQMREVDDKIVTASNKGIVVCSSQGSVALVLEGDKIHGYNIDTNGFKTEMKPAELHQQLNAAMPKLEGTAYQNSDFAKAATHNNNAYQYRRTRV